jgi:ATP-dependent exoDNAse (exonuclease V) alpha subunit
MGLFKSRTSINIARKTLGDLSKIATTSPPKAPEIEETIEVTAEYEEIKRLVDENQKLIFVTGGAGTGKSTFVSWIETKYAGNVAIAAPTGIAALTVSGTTIHRLCKFPPAWIVESDIRIDPKSVISKIDILILDEISMVNANLLDGVDKFCKMQRKNDKPFGGLTIIMVGDLFQLPPIVTHATQPLFQREYGSAKFFAAKAVMESTPSGVELSSPFRQKDEQLIRLLANIREGLALEASIDEFNSGCVITGTPPFGAIHLAPRNRDVEKINARELEKLPLPETTFESQLSGKFSERHLPAPNKVILRVGAQVVFLNNSKEWVNGNIGLVTAVAQDKVTVKLIDTGKTVDVRAYEWKNYDYTYDEKEKKVVRQVIGSFVQIPLLLAWAMTIHKSQGLTLDKVHLDLGSGAFETGQTYVALSRSRSMNSITLARELSLSDILVDKEAIEFYKAIRSED